jgi:DNA-binding LacI/PurR family transcriptional regulator
VNAFSSMGTQSRSTELGHSQLAPTLADVARLAGVSAMTVSRVINGGSVGEATKSKVNRAIRLLRYEPNEAAQVLSRQRARV